MNKVLAAVAVVMAFCSAAVVAVIFLRAAPASDEPESDGSSVEVARLQGDLDAKEAERARADRELEAAEERIRVLEATALGSEALVEELRESAAALAEAAEEEVAEEEPEEPEEEMRKVSLDDIRAKLEASPQASAQIKALTELLYADFINGIELDADAKAELRALLTESYMENMALSRYAIRDGEILWSEVTDWNDEERAYLNDQMKELLPDDDYATWNDFTSTIDERLLESTLRNQIRAFASGLSAENFETVMMVAVEEFRAEQVALEQSDMLFTQTENILYQIRAMAAMRERLEGYLTAEQYGEIDNWLTMAEGMMEQSLPKEEDGQ